MKKFCLFIALIFLTVLYSQESKEKGVVYDLKSFIDSVAQATQKMILYDSTIQGRKVFISNMNWKNPEELYRIFLSVLEHNGYIVENLGHNKELVKIKRNIQGPWTQTPTLYTMEELNKIQEEDRFVTMVIPIQYISVKELQTTLRALRLVNPQAGNFAGLEGSNCLLITDFAPNVKRVYDIIRALDRKPPKEEVHLSPQQTQIKLEGQNIILPVSLEQEIFAILSTTQNAALTITTKSGQVLCHLDPGTNNLKFYLTPYLQENPILYVDVQVLKSGFSSWMLQIESKKAAASTTLTHWKCALARPMPEGKVIRFSLEFHPAQQQSLPPK